MATNVRGLYVCPNSRAFYEPAAIRYLEDGEECVCSMCDEAGAVRSHARYQAAHPSIHRYALIEPHRAAAAPLFPALSRLLRRWGWGSEGAEG